MLNGGDGEAWAIRADESKGRQSKGDMTYPMPNFPTRASNISALKQGVGDLVKFSFGTFGTYKYKCITVIDRAQ